MRWQLADTQKGGGQGHAGSLGMVGASQAGGGVSHRHCCGTLLPPVQCPPPPAPWGQVWDILCVRVRGRVSVSVCVPSASLPLSSLPSTPGCHLLAWCQGQGPLACGARSPPGVRVGDGPQGSPVPTLQAAVLSDPGLCVCSERLHQPRRVRGRAVSARFWGQQGPQRAPGTPCRAVSTAPGVDVSCSDCPGTGTPMRSEICGDDDATPSTQEGRLRLEVAFPAS